MASLSDSSTLAQLPDAKPVAARPAPGPTRKSTKKTTGKAKLPSVKKEQDPSKPKQSKSRNGCATCKAKRLKCDESKPTCLQCKRRDVQCGGYVKGYKWRKFEETTYKTRPLEQEPQDEGNKPARTPAEPQFLPIRPASSASDDAVFAQSPLSPRINFIDDGMFDIFYSSGPRSASLDFTVDPLNGQDVFLNGMPEEMGETNQLSVNFGQDLNTQYEDAELSNSEELILLPFRPSSPRNVWAPMLNVTRIGQSLGDPEMLLSKYDKHTCAILSVRNGPNENPWRTVVWPLALESPALLYAISSLAAFHSAKKRPELKVQGLEHMRNSIRCLADTISYMKVETALATTLVLAFAESWDMHVSTGSHHLRGARSLVRKALSMARRPDILGLGARRAQFLCRAWLYMDVIARLTNVDEPDLDEIDAALWSSVQPRDTHEEIDPLMGCASTLFPLMGAAASLVTKVKKSMSTPINLISQASELKAALETWAPPPVFDDPEDPACDIQHSLQTAEAYRWATLLYLHQAFPELPSKSSTQLARKALVCLAVIPISSRTIIVHIFPLMAAGCEVKSKDDRDWVDERWQSMSQRLQIGNVDRCREVNREVWSRRDQVASPSSASFDFLNLETMMPTSPPQIDLDMQNPTTVEDSRALSPVQLNEPSARDTSTKTDMLDFSKSSDPGPLPLILDEEVMEDLPPNLADGMPGAMPDSAFDMLVDKNLLGSAVAHRPSLGMEFELSSSESSSLGVGVGTKPWSPVEADTLPFDQTVRGSAHWVGVMRDWNWEVFLG